MSEHSEGTWEVSDVSIRGITNIFTGNEWVGRVNKRIDAHRICQCINNFDQMLEMLKDILSFLKRKGYDTTFVKTVIKKAEKKNET